MANMLPFSLSAVTLVIGLLIGSLLHPIVNQTQREIRRPRSEYNLINPLLECDLTINDTNLNRLRDSIRKYIDTQVAQQQISFASVYYRNLNNGPWFGINEKEKFTPASLVKVPVMITAFKIAQSQPGYLNTQILNDQTDNSAQVQNIRPVITLVPDQKYSVFDLVKQMIIYSDNLSYELLLNNIDNGQLIRTYQDLGIILPEDQKILDGNFITVKDYSSFFRILFNASYLSSAYSQKALEILSHSAFKDGLVAGLPENLTVAHKFGERRFTETNELQLHDCGIVYYPNDPYLLCVMTRGNDFKKLSAFINQTSSQIYQYLQSHPSNQ